MKNLTASLVMGAGLGIALGMVGSVGRAGATNDPPGNPGHSPGPIDATQRVVPAGGGSRDPAKDAEIRATLERKMPEIVLDAQPFEQVISYLRELTGLNIVVNWTAMEAAAIEKEAEVSLKLADVTFDGGLCLILDAVGAGEIELAYDVLDGVVIVSTKEDLSRRTFVRVYDVKDLVAWSREEQKARIDSVIESVTKHAGGTVIRDALVKGWMPDPEEKTTDTLVELIRQTIDPESWREAGGNVGSISVLNSCLIIYQTNAAHRQVDQLLAALRKTRDLRKISEERKIVYPPTGLPLP